MKVTGVSVRGLLSFDHFDLVLDKRITVIVGPNGTGKSNFGRVLELVQRAMESADRMSTDLEQMLQVFYGGRRTVIPDDGIEIRIEFELTDEFEQSLLVAFVQAATATALLGNVSGVDSAKIEDWVDHQVTARKLSSLFRGSLVVGHRGTADAQWQVGVEFNVPTARRRQKAYRWILRGSLIDSIVAVDDLSIANLHGQQLADRLRGKPQPQGRPTAPGGVFAISRLLPESRKSVSISLELGRNPPLRASRSFTELIGVDPFGGPDQIRHYSLARVFTTVMRRGLIQTSDSRLLPTPSVSWWTSGIQTRSGTEGNLPEMLLLLKNSPADQRLRYQEIRRRFWELSGGRQLDVAAIPFQTANSRQQVNDVGLQVTPQVLVSVEAVAAEEHELVAQVPIEFAGAGAWEALVLASVLGSRAASIVVLDEPAVALHPTLQRRVRSHLRTSDAQFVVITHSPYLLPLDGDQKDVQIVRFGRDNNSATQPWIVDSAFLARFSKKLLSKGNEALPFAWKVVLCEGATDVEGVRCVAERLNLDLDGLNITVIDTGGRDNLPDYIAFCESLGIPFLAVMDGDLSKAVKDSAVKKNAQAVRSAVQKSQHGNLVEFREDFETTLGVKKQQPSLVMSTLAEISLDEAGPPEIVELVKKIRELVRDESRQPPP